MVETPVTPVAPVTPPAPEAEPKPADVVAEAAQTEEESTILGGIKEEKEVKEEKIPNPEVIVPEKYDYKLPEGMTLDESFATGMTPVFQKAKITQEQAQMLAEGFAPLMKQHYEQIDSNYKAITDGWHKETMEMLGVDADKKLAYAAKTINKLGDPGLREFLDETKVGNYKGLVNLFIKVGTLISEDTLVEGNKTTAPASGDMSVLYNKSFPK